jgi:hypothetical protein
LTITDTVAVPLSGETAAAFVLGGVTATDTVAVFGCLAITYIRAVERSTLAAGIVGVFYLAVRTIVLTVSSQVVEGVARE